MYAAGAPQPTLYLVLKERRTASLMTCAHTETVEEYRAYANVHDGALAVSATSTEMHIVNGDPADRAAVLAQTLGNVAIRHFIDQP